MSDIDAPVDEEFVGRLVERLTRATAKADALPNTADAVRRFTIDYVMVLMEDLLRLAAQGYGLATAAYNGAEQAALMASRTLQAEITPDLQQIVGLMRETLDERNAPADDELREYLASLDVLLRRMTGQPLWEGPDEEDKGEETPTADALGPATALPDEPPPLVAVLELAPAASPPASSVDGVEAAASPPDVSP